jgi:hypothetical protein
VAKDDPQVVAEAITGSCPAGEVTATALLSNGASRLVDTFRIIGWAELLHLLDAEGLAEVIRQVRQTEARTGVATDDATIICCRWAK